MTARQEQPLALSRRRLADAVHAFADPQPQWALGACRWTTPLYTRLRDAMRGRPTRQGRSVPGSRPPCRTDILTHIIAVDMTVAEWQPEGYGAIDRLHRLRERSWRPEDCELLDTYHNQIEQWTVKAVELLGDKAPEVALRLPCPSCGTRFVHRRNGSGETVRCWALRVSEDGARCQHCDAIWSPDRFEFLARLLGCPALPA